MLVLLNKNEFKVHNNEINNHAHVIHLLGVASGAKRAVLHPPPFYKYRQHPHMCEVWCELES